MSRIGDTCPPMRYPHLIAHFGSLTKAARVLNKPKQTVNNWKDAGIPEVEQLVIQKKTGGELKADRRVMSKFRELLRAA